MGFEEKIWKNREVWVVFQRAHLVMDLMAVAPGPWQV